LSVTLCASCGLSRSAAAHKGNQLTRLDGEGHVVEDVTPPGVLADTDRIDGEIVEAIEGLAKGRRQIPLARARARPTVGI
jgi:hypothetical protein